MNDAGALLTAMTCILAISLAGGLISFWTYFSDKGEKKPRA